MKGDGQKRDNVIPKSIVGAEQLLDIPESLGRRYMKISGDFNPIHIHALLAKPFGFKRAIIHGMWTLSRALSHLSPQYIDARFVRPVFLPSEISMTENQDEILIRDPKTNKTQMYIQLHPPKT